ncbi:hypothetical protein I532_01705 [Brevibacillus borstelensis AK1]|uniref:Uncharacterized protein n=1 Tax=Brevibacillus borstelensis AK1 TaxID=1300222 RepID=M8E4S2_9BACL|nr:hypothetical protein [Brevibacillus borstelensis]EMT54281.1 hypothetical protein I532_01705 [Brevibacillus borstelensis AK1]
MEELLTKLLSSLQLPAILIAVLTIGFRLITFLPITFITAQEIENKLYTKEQRLLRQFILYISKMILATMFMLPLGEYFATNPKWYHPWVAIILLVCIMIFFFYIFWMAENRKNVTYITKRKNKLLFLLGSMFYLAATTLLPPYFLGSSLGLMYPELKDSIPFEFLLALMVIFFFCSIFIVYMLKILNKVWPLKTEKVVSIQIEKDGQTEKWYLLYPIKAERYLIGDHYIPELCKRNRIITKEALVEKEFIIENLNDQRKDYSKAENNVNEDTKEMPLNQ